MRELLPNARAAVEWMTAYGDLDGDGFLEYQTRSSAGMRNQGWKDSPDSATHRDGRLAEPPIALAEVQAYAFGAWRAMSTLSGLLGEVHQAHAFAEQAEQVRA